VIRFYFHPTPNPAKVALLLEELGLAYEVVPIDTSKGEQHSPAFRAINPNGKVPAIVDTDGPGGVYGRVFDSSAILLYLGDRTGASSAPPPIGRSCCPGFSSSELASVRSGRAFPTYDYTRHYVWGNGHRYVVYGYGYNGPVAAAGATGPTGPTGAAGTTFPTGCLMCRV